jgi:hypothetical protein
MIKVDFCPLCESKLNGRCRAETNRTSYEPGAANTYRIAAGPDGNLRFTEGRSNRVGKITTAGVVTEFSAGITAGTTPLWHRSRSGRQPLVH